MIGCAVALLLLIYAGIALSSSASRGVSFDEGEELAVGYNIWLNHDFRMEGANGDFVKRWATLPYLISMPRFPTTDDTSWKAAEPYVLGYEFFFHGENRARGLLLQGRIMQVLLGMALGLLVFISTRKVFGLLGAFLSLLIFTFSENMLAYGGIVSTEMSTCLSLFGTTWFVWLLLHQVTWKRLAGSLLFTSMLVLAKPTALVIFPITVILIAVKLASRRPLHWTLFREKVIRKRSTQFGIFLGFIVLHGFTGWCALWAHYDFRYAASPDPGNPSLVFQNIPYSDPLSPLSLNLLSWSREMHFLPEGYLKGIEMLLQSNDERMGFMNGEWRVGGWRTFFLYSIWAKTSPAFLLLLGGGLAGWWHWRNKLRRANPANAGLEAAAFTPAAYGIVPFAVLAAVYIAIAMAQDINIGHRHILPIYPALFVLAGGAASLVWAARVFWARVVIALLLLWRVGDSFTIYPYYLAYFNPLVGGPTQGYKHLVDSSLDWGTGLRDLRYWLEDNNPGGHSPVFLAYFGTGSPEYYKLQVRRLPGFFDWRTKDIFPLTPGIYVISATLLESLYVPTNGPWNELYEKDYQLALRLLQEFDATASDPAKRAALLAAHPPGFYDNLYHGFDYLRFSRLCAWLRHHREPDATVGYSLLIWRLSFRDLEAALFGPPVELEPVPPYVAARVKPDPLKPN